MNPLEARFLLYHCFAALQSASFMLLSPRFRALFDFDERELGEGGVVTGMFRAGDRSSALCLTASLHVHMCKLSNRHSNENECMFINELAGLCVNNKCIN